jgi:hypothetical protein
LKQTKRNGRNDAKNAKDTGSRDKSWIVLLVYKEMCDERRVIKKYEEIFVGKKT